MTALWFPAAVAVLATTAHVALIGYDYWAAARTEKVFDIREFLRRDLQRPLFEPYSFCGAWVHYTAGQSIALGLNFPAYVGATVLQSAVNRRATCVDAVTTPRGQILTVGFVFPLWFIVGSTIRRLAHRRWRSAAVGTISRSLMYLGAVPFLLGVLTLAMGFLALFVSDLSVPFRCAGFSFWMFYISILSAERLRLWRFKSI